MEAVHQGCGASKGLRNAEKPLVGRPVTGPAHGELAAVQTLGVPLQASQDLRVCPPLGVEGRGWQAPPQLGCRLDRLAPRSEQSGGLVAVEVE